MPNDYKNQPMCVVLFQQHPPTKWDDFLDMLQDDFGNRINFDSVSTANNPQLVEKYSICMDPTIIVFCHGAQVMYLPGDDQCCKLLKLYKQGFSMFLDRPAACNFDAECESCQ